MNNTHFGTALSLFTFDLTEQLCRGLGLPLLHLDMSTSDKPIKAGDKNRFNYRLGLHNEALFSLISGQAKADSPSRDEVWEHFNKAEVPVSSMAKPNFGRRGRPVGTPLPKFDGIPRSEYFDQALRLVASQPKQLVLFTPDKGLALKPISGKKKKGDMEMLYPDELGSIVNALKDESLALVYHRMTDVSFSIEKRLRWYSSMLETDITILNDEVLQAGLMIITKSPEVAGLVRSRIQHYLSGYLEMKKSQRILLGHIENDKTIVISSGSFAAPSSSFV